MTVYKGKVKVNNYPSLPLSSPSLRKKTHLHKSMTHFLQSQNFGSLLHFNPFLYSHDFKTRTTLYISSAATIRKQYYS